MRDGCSGLGHGRAIFGDRNGLCIVRRTMRRHDLRDWLGYRNGVAISCWSLSSRFSGLSTLGSD